MRTSIRLVLCLGTLPLATVACSGGGGGGGGGGLGADPGESSGTLNVLATVTCAMTTDSAGAAATCPTFVYVSVEEEESGEDVDDAVVEVGPVGEPMVLASDGNGSYSGQLVGLAAAYQLDVTRGSDFLTGVVLRAPGDFSIGLNPDPPGAGSGATVTWSPSDAEASLVNVYQGFAAITYQGQAGPDDGAESLPDTAFPAPGEYFVEVGRARYLQLAGPFSQGVAIVGRRKPVEVE